MEKARDIFKIGQSVEILANNSHQGEIGKIVAFSERNEYNVKVLLDGDLVQGYMVNELRPIPRLGQEVSKTRKFLQFLSRVARIGKKLYSQKL